MRSKLLILLGYFLFLYLHTVKGYSQSNGQDNAASSIVNLKLNPQNYSSHQRAEIFINAASQYFMSDRDSSYAILEEMKKFGVEQEDDFVMGQSYSSIAQLELMEGKWNQSKNTILKSLPYFQNFQKVLALKYGSLSRSYLVLNQLDSADYYIKKGLALTIKEKDTLNFSTQYVFQANVYSKIKRYSSAVKNYQLALDFMSHAPSPINKATTHRDLASNYAFLEDYKNSEYHIKEGLEIANKEGYDFIEADFYSMLGFQQIKKDNYRSALSNLQKSHNRFIKKNRATRITESYLLLGLCYHKIGTKDSAEYFLSKAKSTFSDITTNKDSITFHLLSGMIYSAKGSYKNAEKHLQKVFAKTVSSDFSFASNKAYKELIAIYQKQNRWEEAAALKDSLIHIVERRNISSQQNIIYDYEQQYQKEIKDSEIALLNREKEIQNLELNRKSRLLYFSLLCLLLAGLAVAGIIYAYKTKAQSNAVLSLKNEQLTSALEANKMLIKEIHHRVKNNLQVVSSLLNLQSRFEKDNTIVKAINTGKYRVQSMSLLHQNLYVNEDLNSIEIQKYFKDLAETLVTEYPLPHTKISLETDIESMYLDVDTVVPLGLIANELLTNSLKYAFTDQENGIITFTIKEEDGKVIMIVKDNGSGIPFTEMPKRSKSMGYQLIHSFSSKLKADIVIDNTEGTEIKLSFEKKDDSPKLKTIQNVAS